MFSKTKIKKCAILLVALLMLALCVFAACDKLTLFSPVALPEGTLDEATNGGVAIKYGNYIYYVNGYNSSVTDDNSYSQAIRSGAVVRVKISDLDDIIKINDQDLSSAKKTEAIKEAVAAKVEVVVPNYYYTGNTTSTALNGIYVFNDRLYITTPGRNLDANGNILSDQLELVSFKMDGSDRRVHFTFESNAPQLKLSKVGNDVYATYVISTKNSSGSTVNNLCSLKLGDKAPAVISENVTSANFTGNYVYYLNSNGDIARFEVGGSAEAKVLEKQEENTYTIVSVNGNYVYYTQSKDTSAKVHFAILSDGHTADGVALNTVPTGSYYGWNDKVIYTAQVGEQDVAMYGIWRASGDGSDKVEIFDASHNGSEIKFNKLEGNTLYYTVSDISYTLDVSDPAATPVAYANKLGTTNTGWSVPDVVGNYVFTLASNSVSVVKYNPETKKNSASTTITLVEPEKK